VQPRLPPALHRHLAQVVLPLQHRVSHRRHGLAGAGGPKRQPRVCLF
jgi:hypothetical protein